MCWFYMGIAQIALEPPPSVKRASVEKKVPQTILTSPDIPGQTWEIGAPYHSGKPLHPPPLMGNAHMETTHFKKGVP